MTTQELVSLLFAPMTRPCRVCSECSLLDAIEGSTVGHLLAGRAAIEVHALLV